MLEKVYKPNEVDTKWAGVWRERGVFTASTDSDKPPYSIILPPPNVTGQLTVGHALGTTVQDLLCRWKRLKGYNVLWLPGTDHAGIATQTVVAKALQGSGTSKEELGRERFIEECWRWKEEYHERIVEQLDRLGASLDWTREAFTLDPGVSRAVRQVFVNLFEKGLIYRDRYIVNWCPACGTAISDEEVVFREHCGKLYYIVYPFADGDGGVVVGTTRPETMLGDVAVAVSPDNPEAAKLKGKMLTLPLTGRTIPIILDDAVDPEFGTGFLKVTPAHDATDFEIGRRHKLDPFVVIGRDGIMNEAAGRFAGLDTAEARRRVLDALRQEGFLGNIDDYQHSIGHHDRCDTVVEPAVSLQWFLRMDSLAAAGIDVVAKGGVTFYPERWKNIYLNWMENIRDWCISRQLWWGHRIPVWYCDGCEEVIAAVDEPRRCTRCGGENLTQDEDVLDTWFSSWLWTFSPMGWPERTRELETFHPTNVLVTGGDIIFFWVARMIMASLEFVGEIPFSDVYITGIVRDTKGFKMSKSLGNSPDPIDVIDAYGADAFRFTLMKLSPPGQDLLFDESKVEIGKHFSNKIWNAARFVLQQPYTEGEMFGDGADGDPLSALCVSLFGRAPSAEAVFGWEDRWITGEFKRALDAFELNIDTYRIDEAIGAAYDFFWHSYCDWFLELAKPLLRKKDRRGRGATVAARINLALSLMMLHPIMPFITEEVWNLVSLRGLILAESRIPDLPDDLVDFSLNERVGQFKEIVSNIRNLRQTFNIPPAQNVRVFINCEEGSPLPGRLEPFREQINRLARVEELEIAENVPRPGGSASAGLTGMEIYVPLKGIIDLDTERRRLRKDLDRISSECAIIEKRLEDERFLERAPRDVVARERSRFEEMSDRRDRLTRILKETV